MSTVSLGMRTISNSPPCQILGSPNRQQTVHFISTIFLSPKMMDQVCKWDIIVGYPVGRWNGFIIHSSLKAQSLKRPSKWQPRWHRIPRVMWRRKLVALHDEPFWLACSRRGCEFFAKTGPELLGSVQIRHKRILWRAAWKIRVQSIAHP